MKLFKIIPLSISILVLFFSSCTDSFDEKIEELIVGNWICSTIDNKNVILDETFVSCYTSQGKELYGSGTIINENNKKWTEKINDYTIEKGTIIVTNEANDFKLHMKIIDLTNKELKYTVTTYIDGGKGITDNCTYVLKKDTVSIAQDILGLWQGYNTTPGATDTEPRRWEYKADGTYVYYSMMVEGSDTTWVPKADNEGKYFTYGHLMVSNWTNDEYSDIKGTMYECWEVEITKEGVMNWKGRRANDKFDYFTMKRK